MWKICVFIATILIAGVASELSDFLEMKYKQTFDGGIEVEIELVCTDGKYSGGRKCEDGRYSLVRTIRGERRPRQFTLDQDILQEDGAKEHYKVEGDELVIEVTETPGSAKTTTRMKFSSTSLTTIDEHGNESVFDKVV